MVFYVDPDPIFHLEESGTEKYFNFVIISNKFNMFHYSCPSETCLNKKIFI